VKGPAGSAGIWSFVAPKCVVHTEAAWTVQQAQLRSERDMSSEWTVPEDGKIPICPVRLIDLQSHLGDIPQKELATRMGVGLRALTNYLKAGTNLAQRIPQGNEAPWDYQTEGAGQSLPRVAYESQQPPGASTVAAVIAALNGVGCRDGDRANHPRWCIFPPREPNAVCSPNPHAT
jgi:hypothetical protein